MNQIYNFSCRYCGFETNCYYVGISPFGRVKCPKCKKYYKCYNIKCKYCGKIFEPLNKIQEEIKKCPKCMMNHTNTPLFNDTKIRVISHY